STTVSVLGWYETYNAGVFSNLISPANAYVSGNKTVYAKLSGTGGCIGVANNLLAVNTTPAGTNTSQTLCSSTAGGNTASFNLTSKNTTVVGASTTVSVLGWYETYNAGVFSTPISPANAYVSGNKTVYAKLSGTGDCIGVANNLLAVNTTPSAPSIAYNPPACDKTTFSITLSDIIPGATYTVRNKDGNPITGIIGLNTPNNLETTYTGGTATSATFSNILAGSGYQVSVSVNGCGSSVSSCAASTPTAIPGGKIAAAPKVAVTKDETPSAGFDAYPVPFKDQLTIKYKFDYRSDVKIEVFNAQGMSVLSKIDTNSYLDKEVTLDLKASKRHQQVYVVKVTTNQGTFTKKVMSSK
ncbi:T9SS type A sorting domain-containing protein, partial [Flavobacterium sp. LS2P90]